MSWRRAASWIALFALLAALGGDGLGRLLPALGEGAGGGERARVPRIVDGDTIKVDLNGRRETVRYIGVDTPETKKPGSPVECFGKMASAYNRRLVEGRRVTLRFDVERRDRYGRLLAYVYLRRRGRTVWVNARLVRDGYATTLTIPPNVRHADVLRRLERRARAERRGLWRACP